MCVEVVVCKQLSSGVRFGTRPEMLPPAAIPAAVVVDDGTWQNSIWEHPPLQPFSNHG